MKNILIPIVFALTVLMYPMPSHAVCNQTGTIVRLTVSGFPSPTHFVFVRRFFFDNFVFVGRTTKDIVAAAASAAIVGQSKVFIQGDAVSCPSIGAQRFIGNIRFLISNP